MTKFLQRCRGTDGKRPSYYHEKDELNFADFIERLRFVQGELHFDADTICGRRESNGVTQVVA